jgi:hypothetical protein
MRNAMQAEADLRKSVGRCYQALRAEQRRVDQSSTAEEWLFHASTRDEIRHSFVLLSGLWESALQKLDS